MGGRVRVAAVALLALAAAALLLHAASLTEVREDATPPDEAPQLLRIEARDAALRALRTGGPAYAAGVERACGDLVQRDRLLDTNCTALWVHGLRHAPVEAVARMWGFEHTHWGAITLVLEGGLRAQFKPCSTQAEDAARELVGFHLDQALQWGQFAPVAFRRVPAAELGALLDDPADLEALALTVERCGLPGGMLEGPMIGWWDGLTMIKTAKKSKADVETLYRQRAALAASPYTAQQMSKFHAFYWLVQILKHGKDEFITPEGHLVALDLDRSRYSSATRPPNSPAVNYTWCYTCLMAREVHETFVAAGPAAPPALRLSALVERSMELDDSPSAPVYAPAMGRRLDERVAMLLSCLEDCFAVYGRDNVLLDELPALSGPELVHWYQVRPKGL